MKQWTTEDIPDLAGSTAIVTGSNRGIGLQVATDLARHHARVIIATRDPKCAQAAVGSILRHVPGGDVDWAPLDLADLASVRAFAHSIAGRFDRLDLLINNAAIGYVPRRLTADGFEATLGTNHFGHFALSGLLMPLLLRTAHARIVTVASSAHGWPQAQIDLEDLNFEHRYRRNAAYARSKLANMLFARELQRRVEQSGQGLRSVAVNPGLTVTKLGPPEPGLRMLLRLRLGGNAQPVARGAVPVLFAAVAPEVRGGDYVRPVVRGGPPAVCAAAAQAYDSSVARRLWELSEQATGVTFVVPDIRERAPVAKAAPSTRLRAEHP
jgi:NAD(P)-dependent dehydrogenase (short-subunit alcohol dehydrogenase family)